MCFRHLKSLKQYKKTSSLSHPPSFPSLPICTSVFYAYTTNCPPQKVAYWFIVLHLAFSLYICYDFDSSNILSLCIKEKCYVILIKNKENHHGDTILSKHLQERSSNASMSGTTVTVMKEKGSGCQGVLSVLSNRC